MKKKILIFVVILVILTTTYILLIKPSSTKTSVAGSTVIWDIPELLKGEERVLSYKMKSKVAGLGNVTIPRAICRFKDKAEKLYIVKSNSFNLF